MNKKLDARDKQRARREKTTREFNDAMAREVSGQDPHEGDALAIEKGYAAGLSYTEQVSVSDPSTDPFLGEQTGPDGVDLGAGNENQEDNVNDTTPPAAEGKVAGGITSDSEQAAADADSAELNQGSNDPTPPAAEGEVPADAASEQEKENAGVGAPTVDDEDESVSENQADEIQQRADRDDTDMPENADEVNDELNENATTLQGDTFDGPPNHDLSNHSKD